MLLLYKIFSYIFLFSFLSLIFYIIGQTSINLLMFIFSRSAYDRFGFYVTLGLRTLIISGIISVSIDLIDKFL